MLRNHFKIALRTLWRKRSFTFINVIGLALSMSVSLVFVLNVKNQFEFDRFHPFSDRTYRIITDQVYSTGTDTYATTPDALAEQLRNYSFVQNVVTLKKGAWMGASSGGKDSRMDIKFADSSFLSVFNFPLLVSNARALTEPGSLIISQKKASYFWGDENAIGKIIHIDDLGDFKVSGVIREPEEPTHFQFDAIVPEGSWKNRKDLSGNTDAWTSMEDSYTYVVLRSSFDQADLEKALQSISKQASARWSKDGTNPKRKKIQFLAEKIIDINPSSRHFVANEMNRGLDWYSIFSILALVLLLLTMAAFNYTGLALSQALSRAKEVGVRKINGARRRQIFAQFLTESVLLTLVALVVAVLIIPFYSHLPVLDEIVKDLRLDGVTVVWIVFFVLIVSFLSGGLPAWILSGIGTMPVLKKLTTYSVHGKRVIFRKGLITIQFAVTVVFIAVILITKKQATFEQEFDHGFSYENLLFVDLNSHEVSTLQKRFEELASVKQVAATSGLPLRQLSSGVCYAQYNGSDSLQVNYYSVDRNFIPTLSIELVAGTNFPQNQGNGKEAYVLLNEKAIKKLGFKTPEEALGKVVRLDNSYCQVAGVFRDFINWNVEFGSMPFALRYRPAEFSQLVLKIDPVQPERTVKLLTAVWKKTFSDQPFTYQYYDSFIHQSFEGRTRGLLLIDFLAFLILSLACLGLVGTVAYSVEGRVKEIGIRRALGAAGFQLIWLVSRDFMTILLWAGVLGLPVAYYIGETILNNYAYRIELSYGIWLSSFLIMFVIGLLTVFSQTYRASYVDPADSLRAE